jgi:hypothetical protein
VRNFLTVAAPIPEAAPVTIATLFSNRPVIFTIPLQCTDTFQRSQCQNWQIRWTGKESKAPPGTDQKMGHPGFRVLAREFRRNAIHPEFPVCLSARMTLEKKKEMARDSPNLFQSPSCQIPGIP